MRSRAGVSPTTSIASHRGLRRRDALARTRRFSPVERVRRALARVQVQQRRSASDRAAATKLGQADQARRSLPPGIGERAIHRPARPRDTGTPRPAGISSCRLLRRRPTAPEPRALERRRTKRRVRPAAGSGHLAGPGPPPRSRSGRRSSPPTPTAPRPARRARARRRAARRIGDRSIAAAAVRSDTTPTIAHARARQRSRPGPRRPEREGPRAADDLPRRRTPRASAPAPSRLHPAVDASRRLRRPRRSTGRSRRTRAPSSSRSRHGSDVERHGPGRLTTTRAP